MNIRLCTISVFGTSAASPWSKVAERRLSADKSPVFAKISGQALRLGSGMRARKGCIPAQQTSAGSFSLRLVNTDSVQENCMLSHASIRRIAEVALQLLERLICCPCKIIRVLVLFLFVLAYWCRSDVETTKALCSMSSTTVLRS